ncbi:MAG: hypothetical protein CFE21_14600 [Bacteroidetes bacterium B1(2017)]|nr:MAG: hypothetical protein CFE21_14600 [Bacteroidetes bacterium B1(2017)]
MPVFLQKNLNAETLLAVWHIQESKEQLLDLLGKNLSEESQNLRLNSANALHYLASRVVLCELFKNQEITLTKNAQNKPSLWINKKEWNISITHSHEFAAIIITPTGKIGIDIEQINSRISRVKHKFLNQTELDFAGSENQIEEQTLIWSAKETLYKIYSLKELDFKLNLFIKPFQISSQGQFQGIINKNTFHQECTIQYLKIQNYFLTYSYKP